MKKPFTYNGRQLEVQAGYYNGVWLVRVFEHGAPAGSVQYQVEGPTELGAEPTDMLEGLMSIVEEDFRRSSDRLKERPATEILNADSIAGLVLATMAARKVTD